MLNKTYDIVITGAGIVGLAHAYIAAQHGLRVAVVERDHRCVGASIRNFGFITVTGQGAGDTWRRAARSRDVWLEVAPQAGIAILHRGLWLLAKQPEATRVLQAFCHTDMGAACSLMDAMEAAIQAPFLHSQDALCALYSPHELRVESRTAIPLLAAWLQEQKGVDFYYGEEVLEADKGKVKTAQRELHAGRVVLCPGTEMNGVAQPYFAADKLQLSRLQMLRVRPQPGFKLSAAVMTDLSLVRYRGYAELPEAAALLAVLQQQEAESLANGIHLIAVQSADGTLVVGDSHHNAASPEPFGSEAVDELILRHLKESLRLTQCDVTQRWSGVYPTGAGQDCLIKAPDAQTRAVLVTSGTGASTAFGIAEDVFNNWS
ncbi:MAG: TIGR03364 family FAD-dependent oxidoreductase [Burkholderiaceae bacterium]